MIENNKINSNGPIKYLKIKTNGKNNLKYRKICKNIKEIKNTDKFKNKIK